MTTIATDGKSMAGDSQVTCHNEITGSVVKVHKLDDGRIIGSCGPSVCCSKFRTYMTEGGDKPPLSDDFCALILKPNGSGSEYAIGAMMAGKSPHDAVAIGIDRDCKSGGDITEIKLNDD